MEIILQMRQPVRQGDPLRIFAVIKCPTSNGRDTVGQLHAVQGKAGIKGVLANGFETAVSFKDNACQSVTAGKCALRNGFHAAWNDDLP